MNVQLITDIISLVFICLGAFFVLSASIGLVRFKDSMSRVHVVTKPQTVGLILTVMGAIIRMLGHDKFDIGQRGDLGILVLLVIFALLTSPVTGQRLGRVVRREALYGTADTVSRNEAPAERTKKRSTK